MQNDAPSTPTAAAAGQPWAERLKQAAARVDTRAWLAVALVFCAWFVLDTLRFEWGPVRQGIHFYEIAAVVSVPTRLLTGLDGQRGAGTFLFAVLCCVTLAAPMLPYLWPRRMAWFAWIAPFALLVICAALLYVRTSGDVFHVSGADTLGNDFRHIANHLVHHAGAGVAREVRFAAGAYLALLGSAYLAVRGWRSYKNFRG